MKGKMMSRFGEEATELYIETEKQKEGMREELYKEKTMRMRLEEELRGVKEEKENLEHSYCSLVENHRRLLKADIERNRASLLHKSSLHKSNTAEHLQTSSAKKT